VQETFDRGYWRATHAMTEEIFEFIKELWPIWMAEGRTSLFFGLITADFKVTRGVKSWIAEEHVGFRECARTVVAEALKEFQETGKTTDTRTLLAKAMKISGGKYNPKLLHEYIISEVP